MADQAITVFVRQPSSGNSITVQWHYASDGHMVDKGRTYMRQEGMATIDVAMARDIAEAVRSVVSDHLTRRNLW